MFRRFFKRSSQPTVAEPYWPGALGAPKGPAAPILRLQMNEKYLRRLGVALVQRGMRPMEGDGHRWRSTMRAVYARSLPDSSRMLVVLAGNRKEELLQGLQLEAGLLIRPGDDVAGRLESDELQHPERVWHIGLPSNWRSVCDGEARQIAEARERIRSRYPDRRCSGASTLARLQLMDRGPWVEEAIVSWEASSGRGDLAIATLFAHELSWLRMAKDPLARPLHRFLWALAQDREAVQVLLSDLGDPPKLSAEQRSTLLAQVPAQVAAAAMGVHPERREGFAGEARYREALNQIQDMSTRAALRVEAADVLLEMYGSGWNVPRLEGVLELLQAALTQFADGQPTSKARTLILQARALEGLHRFDVARTSLEDAAKLILDHNGRPRDPQLAREILLSLERLETRAPLE